MDIKKSLLITLAFGLPFTHGMEQTEQEFKDNKEIMKNKQITQSILERGSQDEKDKSTILNTNFMSKEEFLKLKTQEISNNIKEYYQSIKKINEDIAALRSSALRSSGMLNAPVAAMISEFFEASEQHKNEKLFNKKHKTLKDCLNNVFQLFFRHTIGEFYDLSTTDISKYLNVELTKRKVLPTHSVENFCSFFDIGEVDDQFNTLLRKKLSLFINFFRYSFTEIAPYLSPQEIEKYMMEDYSKEIKEELKPEEIAKCALLWNVQASSTPLVELANQYDRNKQVIDTFINKIKNDMNYSYIPRYALIPYLMAGDFRPIFLSFADNRFTFRGKKEWQLLKQEDEKINTLLDPQIHPKIFIKKFKENFPEINIEEMGHQQIKDIVINKSSETKSRLKEIEKKFKLIIPEKTLDFIGSKLRLFTDKQSLIPPKTHYDREIESIIIPAPQQTEEAPPQALTQQTEEAPAQALMQQMEQLQIQKPEEEKSSLMEEPEEELVLRTTQAVAPEGGWNKKDQERSRITNQEKEIKKMQIFKEQQKKLERFKEKHTLREDVDGFLLGPDMTEQRISLLKKICSNPTNVEMIADLFHPGSRAKLTFNEAKKLFENLSCSVDQSTASSHTHVSMPSGYGFCLVNPHGPGKEDTYGPRTMSNIKQMIDLHLYWSSLQPTL